MSMRKSACYCSNDVFFSSPPLENVVHQYENTIINSYQTYEFVKFCNLGLFIIQNYMITLTESIYCTELIIINHQSITKIQQVKAEYIGLAQFTYHMDRQK